ncbi:DEAD/DEAH box helicase [Planctomicrobium sp.]|nr:DEAD/DEAH box helicase [Planctomicrobium sp.]MDB4733471.1 DEAD/DEAH box helicase [Planctomicrobium sp.]MDB4793128.1 DEAD/DEAH box helicase [bacterium]
MPSGNESDSSIDREELVVQYLDQIPYDPYPVQEDALLTWFGEGEGILVCAPTGTGKTLIAEAAMYEALSMGKVAYYTTPLIALSEQKFDELQEAAERWGFSRDDIGLITGNRRVNPDAPVRVVVAEILLNRLLSAEEFDFDNVTAVVMDEFHNFNDPQRGVVWELSLALLPKHVRLMLLSATVGNSVDFLLWLRREHQRKIQLIQESERKVSLQFNWVGDELLAEQLELMQDGTEETKKTPALVFVFNRQECWTVAEQLKGKSLLGSGQQKALAKRLDEWDWKIGSGPKLKQLLMRGVGVHHAGMLPRYRRRVETLFQEKLLSVCICTETLAAGINLPARSVVMTTLMKGPPGKKSIVDASSAHQIFGRAGRPQFDKEGFVFAMAHEDDVKIARAKEQYDQIPEDTKDPNLIRMKKKLKKKMPTRRANEQYWNEEQFQKVIDAPSRNLVSQGNLPWRLLAYLLQVSPDVARLKRFANKRLLPPKLKEKVDQRLTKQLITLYAGDFIDLDPPPEDVVKVTLDWPMPNEADEETAEGKTDSDEFGAGLAEDLDSSEVEEVVEETPAEAEPSMGTFGALLQEALVEESPDEPAKSQVKKIIHPSKVDEIEEYLPKLATPTERMSRLLSFRGCHPIYGTFLLDHLGIADRAERIQILESVLEIPGSMIRDVRVPGPHELPPGPLATHRVDPVLMSRGLISQSELDPDSVEPELDNFGKPIRTYAVPLGDKMRRLFDSEYPGVQDLRIRSAWVVGQLLHYGGDFQTYVTSRDLTKQEGVIFRHLLRMILLCQEFSQFCPTGTTEEEWQSEMTSISDQLTETCRVVDPESTDKALESMAAGPDITQG